MNNPVLHYLHYISISHFIVNILSYSPSMRLQLMTAERRGLFESSTVCGLVIPSSEHFHYTVDPMTQGEYFANSTVLLELV